MNQLCRKWFVSISLSLSVMGCTSGAQSQQGMDSAYVQAVQRISQRVSLANPYLAGRMQSYFIQEHANQETDPYDVYLRVIQKDPSFGAGSFVEHLAQEHFGRLFGIAMVPSAVPGWFERDKTADDAKLRALGVSSDKDAPLSLMSDTRKDISVWRKCLIYEESVDIFLANVRKFHPELIGYFTELFLVPNKNYDDYPRALKLYQQRVDSAIEKNQADFLKSTSISFIQFEANTLYKGDHGISQTSPGSGH